MNAARENSRSLWMGEDFPLALPLHEDESIEVLVIGAGIAGLSTAYELLRHGRKVMVVDRGRIAGGMSARTSAHLTYVCDDLFHVFIKRHGQEQARQFFASQRAAVDRIEQAAVREDIACDFARLDGFTCAVDDEGREALERELEACDSIGFAGVRWAEAPLRGRTHGCLRFPSQARFHPLKYLRGLAAACTSLGGRLHDDTAITSVEERDGRVIAIAARGQTIKADAAVVATNTPFVDQLAIHTKQAPYRTYVVALELRGDDLPDALIWDTEDPYHYVRRQPHGDGQVVLVGGEDHKTGTVDDGAKRIRRLESWARRRLPGIGRKVAAWSGQTYEPADHAPYIGLNPGNERVFIVTGDSGQGLTTGVAASLILPDLIAGRSHEWAPVYDPSRKPSTAASLGEYVRENLGVAANMTEHLTPGERKAARIARGKGAVIREGMHKVAAFRDEDGTLHRMSASCTHAGCVVHWNDFEKCWDCPCHGSHFSPRGQVLQGPATQRLGAAEESAPRRRASADAD